MPRLLIAVLAAGALLVPTAAAQAAPEDVVVNEVYGGGGNAGATLKQDFVELYNSGSEAVSLDGWSVQYASATGSSWGVTRLADEIPAGGFYLVQMAQGAGGTQDIPTPDATGTSAMALGAGKVALVTNTTALACATNCPRDTIRDLVGYGSTASDFEGAGPTANTTSPTSAGRRVDGVDTNQNGADFVVGAPTPRNSGRDRAPSIASSDPAHNAQDVPRDKTIRVTFSEPVTAQPAGFSLACANSGPREIVVTRESDTVYAADPAQDLPEAETCTLTVARDSVSDADANDPPDAMTSDGSVRFSTPGLTTLRIHDIQGAAHRSPYDLRWVAGVPGVVTSISSNGFHMQDDQPDADGDTSEGIFVFGGQQGRTVGQRVLVAGRVTEFRPGGENGNNLTLTEISFPTVTPAGAADPIAPTLLGTGGLQPPLSIIDNDSSGSVEAPGFLFDPEQDGIDFHESLEGMYVEIAAGSQAVGPTNGFGELAVVSGGAGPRTPRGGIHVRPSDFNPERFILDDGMGTTPKANVGDRFDGPVRAVVDYSFGNFKYLLTATPVLTPGGLQREVTEPADRHQLAIGSMNVENLSAAERDQSKFDRLARILVDNLRSPDIVALEEIQDNDGAPAEGNANADLTWQRFIAAVAAAGGPVYEYRQIDPEPGRDGGEPGGNIRVGFLFRTDRGLRFVDRPGGTSTTGTEEDATRGGAQLTFSPGRLDPTNEAFLNSRKPLAGEFRWRGETVFVIANHFNSKGGDDPLFGRYQPPVRHTEVQRHKQATVVRDFTRSLLGADRRAAVVVVGDLNDFEFSRTLDIVESAPMVNLMETLPEAERYSYVFDGNSQTLDQILVTAALRRRAEYDSVHVNAEFTDQASDHDPQVARLAVGGDDDDDGDDGDDDSDSDSDSDD